VVERVVRVACPARGTLLASKRLDAYLSVLKWTLDLAGLPVLPELLDFLAEVARRRADPSQIPGLAAMIPDTPLVQWLNDATAAHPGDLRVVAGDLEGDTLGSWLKTLLADAYYWTDNDIVVQTRSMYGGTPRSGGASFLLDQGGKATHFDYFRNPRTVDAVVDGLMQATPPPGYRPIGPLSWAGLGVPTASVRAAAAAQPNRTNPPCCCCRASWAATWRLAANASGWACASSAVWTGWPTCPGRPTCSPTAPSAWSTTTWPSTWRPRTR
jgi:hypothetical protein